MRIKKILAMVSLVAVLGFSPLSQAEETQVLPFSDPEMYEMLKPVLRSRGVWFEDLSDNRIRVKAIDVSIIFKLMGEEIDKIIPQGRSASLEKNLLGEVISRLEFEQIPFTTRCFDNSRWIIWEAQYTQRIEKIIDEAAIKVLPTSTGEFATCA
jgi:hypothetical protein